MGKKINVKNLSVFFVFLSLSIIFNYQILLGKIPFNGNLLASFFTPWREVLPFKFMGVDEVREFYPLLDFTYDSLRSSNLPLWNPYNFSGYSHIGNWASAVFYPINLSMFILSKGWTLIVLKLSVIIISGVSMYFYLRAIKLSVLSSYFGACAFAFSATMQIWNAEIWQSAHSFAWLPLALFSIEKIIRKGQVKFSILLALSIALSILAGYIQPTIYLIGISCLYSVFRIFAEKKREIHIIVKLLSGFLLGICISSVQLFPAIEAYILSPRSLVSLHDLNVSFLLPIRNIITLLVPDFFGNIVKQNFFITRPGQYYENMIYVGIIPLIPLSFSVLSKKYINYVIFFGVAALISLSFTFDFQSSKLIYDFSIPFLSSAIPIRIIFVFAFSVAILSAIGLEWWLSEKNKAKTLVALAPVSISLVTIAIFVIYSIVNKLKIISFPDEWYLISARNVVLPTFFGASSIIVLLLGQYFLKFKNYLGIVLVSLLLISSFMFMQTYVSFSEKKFFYPEHPLISFIQKNQGTYRYYGYGSASLPNNFTTVYKIYSPEGYDPVNNIYYNELLSSSRNAEYEGTFSRSDAELYPVIEFPFEDIKDTRYRIMDMLGIKYLGFEKEELLKIDKKRLDLSRYAKVWEKDNFVVFENKNVFPRAFFVDRIILRSEKKARINELYDKNIDLRNTAITQEQISLSENKSSASASIVSYSQNKIVIDTESKEDKMLVLSDAFYPGWKAQVLGESQVNKDTKIYKVDHALRGVVVLAGKNTVVFSYQPLSFYAGLSVTVLSLAFASSIYFLKSR